LPEKVAEHKEKKKQNKKENAPDERRQRAALNGKRVLVIEDTAENMRLFRAVLKLEGALVLEADGARRGIEIAQSEQPDMILMDIQMPEMDGLEATRLLRSNPQTCNIPIVAVTASVMDRDRSKTLEAGCDGHIPKTYRPLQCLVSKSLPFCVRKDKIEVTMPDSMGENHNRVRDSAANSPVQSAGRILVVDDVAANVRLLAGILKVADYDVVSADSGPQALDIIKAGDFDLAMLDVMMPDMDGFEVCRRIRENAAISTLPVIMVTALHESEDRVRAIEAGANDFLTKPVDDVEVVARVRSLVQAKKDRDKLENAYNDLQSAESLRDSLSAMLVHDLRTPLTTIIGPLEMLQGQHFGPLNDTQQEVLAMSTRSAYRLLNLVNELLDVSKLESGQMTLQKKSVDFHRLVDEAIEQVAMSHTDDAERIEREYSNDAPLVAADDELMRRVLVNLLGNALKFAPLESKVTIGTRMAEEGVLFWVRDEGDGIHPEDQQRIFEKFGQAASRNAGRKLSTGLGLTFCKLAVEAHGGRIWLESTPGQGSTFFVAVPQN
jgi:CheY-like chemotaxis protein/two-component sensor histidine kinase